MCGRVILLSLLVLSFSTTALPQCSFTPRFSGQYRSTVFDVAVDADGMVWIATGYGIQLLQPRAGGGVTLLDSAAIAGSTRVLALNGSLAYVGSGSRVYVVRRTGNSLSVIRSVDAGGTVNDMLVAEDLFVATSSGIAHFDLIDPANPFRMNTVITTSRPSVTSLARTGSTIYAADGDLTLEVISISNVALPQKVGTVESLARSTAVHTLGNGLFFVSDDVGASSDVFSGLTRLARIPLGSNSLVALTTNIFFIAGPDRTVRAIDAANTARIAELFEQQLPPTGGTSNRIHAMARAGNTLYVAAGDVGLVTYDVSTLAPSHPLVSYADGARTSALAIGSRTFFTDAAGTISELSVVAGISLLPSRTWAGGAAALLRDHATTTILTSSGSSVKLWTVDALATAFTATFRDTVKNAVLAGNNAVALLNDGSAWRIALDATAPQQIDTGGTKMAYLADAGNAVALAHVTDEGRTIIRYYAAGDFAAPTRTFELDGAAIGSIALNATYAAAFTFRGVSVIDLTNGNVRVFEESHRLIPRQLRFAGNDLLVLGDRALAVWSATNGKMRREHPLPANAIAMFVEPALAAIASAEGPMAVQYAGELPSATLATANSYYDKAVAAGDHLHLFDDGRIDVFWASGSAPRFATTIDAAGAIDLAALPQTIFTLSANGTVTAWSLAGAQLAQKTIDEGSDAQFLAIHTAGDAVWVSVESGCLSGNCERRTLILDPKTLAITASRSGGVIDVVTSGTRAYALVQLPDEIRVIDIANPTQPSLIVAAASPASAKAIGSGAGRVYVLADKVYAFNESLIPAGEFPVTGQTFRIDGSCAIVDTPMLFNLPAWVASGTQLEVPSTVQSLVVQPGRAFLLTEHSIEVWTTAAPPAPPRRRAAR